MCCTRACIYKCRLPLLLLIMVIVADGNSCCDTKAANWSNEEPTARIALIAAAEDEGWRWCKYSWGNDKCSRSGSHKRDSFGLTSGAWGRELSGMGMFLT